MDSETIKKAMDLIELTNENICDHCLGRKFSDKIEAENNQERGKILRKEIAISNNFSNLEKYEKYGKNGKYEKCPICEDILLKIDENLKNEAILEKIIAKIEYLDLEFNNFLLGSKIPKEMLQKDEDLNNELDLDVENIKKEINREIGKLLEKKLQKEVEFENPDIVIMVDLNNILKTNPNPIDEVKVRIQINPIFIEGRYLKLIRGIPQTKWPCRKCKGRGCKDCNDTGKMYEESVEELISEIVLKNSYGRSAKFHGAGREDIDVRMLGTGRPFVLEIKEPKVRNLNLEKIAIEVNEHSAGKTQYNDLKFTYRNRKAEIKVSSPDTYKTYRALVECDQEVEEDKLEKLQTLNIIKQQTPQRVAHRRADKIRTREVKNISTNLIDSKTFEMIIKTQGGLYIKELISSDDGRSKPSVSELLELKAICKELDVIEVGNDR